MCFEIAVNVDNLLQTKSSIKLFDLGNIFRERECGKVKRKITKCGMFCDFNVRYHAHEVCSNVEVVLVL